VEGPVIVLTCLSIRPSINGSPRPKEGGSLNYIESFAALARKTRQDGMNYRAMQHPLDRVNEGGVRGIAYLRTNCSAHGESTPLRKCTSSATGIHIGSAVRVGTPAIRRAIWSIAKEVGKDVYRSAAAIDKAG
jgi:hypothetical protein